MAKKIIIYSLFIALIALLVAGCGQQVKEGNLGKMDKEVSTGFPIKVGLQDEEGLPVKVEALNESGLPVKVSVQKNEKLPVELKLQNGQSIPVNLNPPNDKSFLVEIDTKDKQVLPVRVDGLENLEKFLKAIVADINSFSIKLNIPDGTRLPPMQVSLHPVSSKVLMAVAISILAVMIAVFGALLTAFFAWRTSLNMKIIEKKILNSDIDK